MGSGWKQVYLYLTSLLDRVNRRDDDDGGGFGRCRFFSLLRCLDRVRRRSGSTSFSYYLHFDSFTGLAGWLAGRREGYGYLITRWDYRIFFSVASFLILAAAGHGSRLQVSSCCCGIAGQQSNDDDVKICHQATVLGEEEDSD